MDKNSSRSPADRSNVILRYFCTVRYIERCAALSKCRLDNTSVEIRDKKPLAALDDLVPFILQALAESGNTAGILGVEFTARFQSPPIRRDPTSAFRFGLGCRMRRDPSKDACRQRTGNSCAMLLRKSGSNFFDRR